MDNKAEMEPKINLTGILTAPRRAASTKEGAVQLTTPVNENDLDLFSQNRIDYMLEADPLGTAPLPWTLRGAKSSIKASMMNESYVFIDKLGERIAFERSGTRLYEALISKYHGTVDKSILPPLEILQLFHDEELRHFQLAAEAMRVSGGDPTATTPSADVCGVAALGWVQAMTDPRTTFKQCLEIILQAELVDNACWEVLIELASDTGLTDIQEQFQKALEEEVVHLVTIKQWVREMNVTGKIDTTIKH